MQQLAIRQQCQSYTAPGNRSVRCTETATVQVKHVDDIAPNYGFYCAAHGADILRQLLDAGLPWEMVHSQCGHAEEVKV